MKPLQVLMFIASPGDRPLGHDLEEEMVAQALSPLLEANRAEFAVPIMGTLKSLQKACERLQPDILVISCHGSESGLQMETESGESDSVSPQRLAVALRSSTPQLVLLSSCLSGAEVAPTLERFVPEVISYSTPVLDSVAAVVTNEVLEGVINGRTPLECVIAARSRLGQSSDWKIADQSWSILHHSTKPSVPIVAKTLPHSPSVLAERPFIIRRRKLLKSLLRLINSGNRMVWLHGPRGIGKRTLIRHYAQEIGASVVEMGSHRLSGAPFSSETEASCLIVATQSSEQIESIVENGQDWHLDDLRLLMGSDLKTLCIIVSETPCNEPGHGIAHFSVPPLRKVEAKIVAARLSRIPKQLSQEYARHPGAVAMLLNKASDSATPTQIRRLRNELEQEFLPTAAMDCEPESRRRLARLSALADAFSPEDASVVLETSLDESKAFLVQCAGSGLISTHSDSNPEAFSIDPVSCGYFLRREEMEVQSAHEIAGPHYESAAEDLVMTSKPEYRTLKEALELLLRARHHHLKCGQTEQALGIFEGLVKIFSDLRRFDLGKQLAAKSLQTPGIDNLRRAAVLHNHGYFCSNLGETDSALRSLRESIKLSAQESDYEWAAKSAQMLGDTLRRQLDVEGSLNALKEAEAYADRAGDKTLKATTWISLAPALYASKQPKSAETYFRKLSSLDLEGLPTRIRVGTLGELAGYFSKRGEYEKAFESAEKAIKEAESIRDRQNEAELRITRAGLIKQHVHPRNVQAFLYASQELESLADYYTKEGSNLNLIKVLINRMEILLALARNPSDYDECIQIGLRAKLAASRISHPSKELSVDIQLLLVCNESPQLHRYLNSAISEAERWDVVEEREDATQEPVRLQNLARAYKRLGLTNQVEAALYKAMEQCSDEHRFEKACIKGELASHLWDQKKLDLAEALFMEIEADFVALAHPAHAERTRINLKRLRMERGQSEGGVA